MSVPVPTPIDLGPRFRPNPVLMKGEGRPVVYLHGIFGPEWNGPLDDLSRTRRVIAPANVGARDLDELAHMDGLLDLLVYYDEVFERLGLERFDLIGHSFGGMVAAEYAALFPRKVERLVLIDALGLWRDDHPIADYNYVPPAQQAGLLFADMSNPGVLALTAAMPTDPAELVSWGLDRMTALGSTNHFLWPIPDRGLHKRLERIKAPTLILWGAEDRIAPPVYAEAFASRIPGATRRLIAGAGHLPQVEQPAEVSAALRAFLD